MSTIADTHFESPFAASQSTQPDEQELAGHEYSPMLDAEQSGAPPYDLEDPEMLWEGEFGGVDHSHDYEDASFESHEELEASTGYDEESHGFDTAAEEAFVLEHQSDESHIGHEHELFMESEFDHDPETGVEQEIISGTQTLRSIPAYPAKPPCASPSPATPTAPSDPPTRTGSGGRSRNRAPRVPDYRPGSGRVRRRYSREYVMWVQRSLNQVMGTALAVDGIWGRRTAAALRQFQRREGLQVDGVIGPQSEGRLRRYVRVDPPEREAEFEGIAPAVAIAGAGLALSFAKFGFETIGKMTSGDISFHGPRQSVGIRASNVPNTFLLKPRRRNILLTNFIEKVAGIELLNIKLRCSVIYDGVNLDARFQFDPQGRRSRGNRDTEIRIGDPMGLETEQAPVAWQRCGVPDYRVLRIPVSFRINRPWPRDNYNETFELVLSTMYGFGATARGPRHKHIQNQRVAWN